MPEFRINGEAVTDGEYAESPNWFGRVMVGGMSIIGIAQVAAKIGGPVGDAINISIKDQANSAMEKLLAQDAGNNFDAVGDFQHKIQLEDGSIFKPGEIKSGEEMASIFKSHYEMDDASASVSNRIKGAEDQISKAIWDAKKGENLYTQLESLNGTNTSSFYINGKAISGTRYKSEKVILKAVQVDALKQYASSMRTSGDNISMDLFDVSVDNLDTADVELIQANHNRMIKSNKKYADLYYEKIKKMRETVRQNIIKANPQMPLSAHDVLVPNSHGSVGDMMVDATNNTVTMKNQSLELYTVKYATDNSRTVVNKRNVSNNMFSDEIINNPFFRRYDIELKKTAGLLRDMQANSAGRIKNTSINYKNIGGANYFEVRITRDFSTNSSNDLVRLIPIVDNTGSVPKLKGTQKRQLADLILVQKEYGVANQTKTINTTLRHIHDLNNTLKTNLAEVDLVGGDISNWQQLQTKLNIGAYGIEDTLSLLEGEGRDLYKMHGARMAIDQEFRVLNRPSQNTAMASYKAGVDSLLNMSRAKDVNGTTITIDLEALNVHGKTSPGALAMRTTTGLWSASIQVADSSGKVSSMTEISSTHIFKEQRLDRFIGNNGYIDKALINEALNAGYGSAGLRDFAEFQRSSLGVKSNDLADAVEAFMNVVKDKSASSPTGEIKSSAEFGNEVISIIRKAIKDNEKNGKVNLLFANGTQFDMPLLETLTGNFNDLKKSVNIIDLTDVSRVLNIGKFDKTGNKLSRIATQHVLNAFPELHKDKYKFDLVNNTKESIRLLSTPKFKLISSSKADQTIMGMLEGAIGKGEVQLHTSAAADTLLTYIGYRAMLKNGEDASSSTNEQMNIVNNFIDGIQGNMYDKTASDAYQMSGLLTIDGVRSTISGLSNTQALKGTGSLINPGNINPFWSLNPWAKQLHQYDRHGYIRKKNQSPKHRYRTAITSNIAEQMSNQAYRTADMDKNIFANKLVFKTAYTVGSYGNQEGAAGILRSVHDDLAGMFTTNKSIKMDIASMNFNTPGLHTDVWNIYNKALNAAKEQQAAGGSLMGSNSDAVMNFIQDAFAEEVAKTPGNLQIDPDNPAHQRMLLGPNDVDISQSSISANVIGIKLDVDPTTNKVSNMLLQIQEAAGISNGVVNTMQGKSVANIIDVNEAVMKNGLSALGYKSTALPEMFTALDALDKGYIGTVKDIAIKKIMYQANEVLDSSTSTAREKSEARKAMKQVAGLMKELGGASIVENDGFHQLKFDDKLANMSSEKIMTGAHNISFTSIMDIYSTVGHDLTWTHQQMMEYYGLFGSHGNDILVGREKLNKVIAGHSFGVKGTPEGQIQEMKKLMANDSTKFDAILDPLSQVAHELESNEKFVKYKNSGLTGLFSENNATVSNVINQMKIGKFFEAVVDARSTERDGTFKTTFGIYGVNDAPIGGQGKDTFKINADIYLRHGYFDNLLSSKFTSMTNKKMMMNSQTVKTNAQAADIANSINTLLDGMQNNNLSELNSKYGLSVSDIENIVSKKDTRQAIINKIGGLANGKDSDLMSEQKRLDAMLANGHLKDANQRDAQLMTFKSEREKLLQDQYDKPKFVSNSAVDSMLKLGGEDAMGILPLHQQFTIDLMAFAESTHNRAQMGKNPLDIQATINYVKQLTERAQSDKNYDPKNMLMRIETTSDGRDLLHMNGLPMPLHNEINNVASRMDTPLGEGFTGLSESAKLQSELFDSYMVLRNQASASPDMIAKHANDTFMNWSKMMSNAISLDKDSLWNLGTQTSTLQGVRAHYDVTDNITLKAKSYLDVINGGAQNERVESIFKGMSVDKQQSFKKHLGMIANAGDATTFVSAQNVFGSNLKMGMGDGSSIVFNDMLKSGSKRLRLEANDIKNGLATIPGGATRFPIEPSAQLGLLQMNILGLQDEFMDMAGIDKHRIYMNSVVGALQKADTDGDMTNLIIGGYNTYEHLEMSRVEGAMAQKHMFANADVQTIINQYNDKGLVTGITQDGNGVTKYTVAEMRLDGKGSKGIEMTAEAYYERFENSTIATNLKNISNNKFTHLDMNKSVNQAVENHIQTSAVGVWSSNTIGLVTNTMRERARDVTLLKSITGSNSLDAMFGTIESAFGEMTQLSIKMGKHADFDEVKKISDVALFMSNPMTEDMDLQKNAKNHFLEFYKGDKKQEMDSMWESYLDGTRLIDRLKNDGEHGKIFDRYRKVEADIQLGRDRASIFGAAEYKAYNDKVSTALETSISQRGNEMMKTSINVMSARAEGSLDLNLLRQSDAFIDTATKKYSNRKFADLASNKIMQRGGKFAAFAGMALIGANMFSPMVGTGVDSLAGKNHAINSELELGRGVALDQVNASFSKEAFAYMNDLDTNKKELEGNIMHQMIQSQTQNTVFGHQAKQFKSRADVTRINRMGYIGPFGSSEYSRGL